MSKDCFLRMLSNSVSRAGSLLGLPSRGRSTLSLTPVRIIGCAEHVSFRRPKARTCNRRGGLSERKLGEQDFAPGSAANDKWTYRQFARSCVFAQARLRE